MRRNGKHNFCNCCSIKFKLIGCCCAGDDDDEGDDDADGNGIGIFLGRTNEVVARNCVHLFVIRNTNAMAEPKLLKPSNSTVSLDAYFARI